MRIFYDCSHSGLPSSHFFFRCRQVRHPVLDLPSLVLGLAGTVSVLFRGRPRFFCEFPMEMIEEGVIRFPPSNDTWISRGDSQSSSTLGLISSTSDSMAERFEEDLRTGLSTGVEANEDVEFSDCGRLESCFGMGRFDTRARLFILLSKDFFRIPSPHLFIPSRFPSPGGGQIFRFVKPRYYPETKDLNVLK